jgi:hypothetical protein
MASAPGASDVAKRPCTSWPFSFDSKKKTKIVSLDRRPFGGNAGTRTFFEKLAQL